MSDIHHQSRKSHTKSRLGCAACKQRHQKCDETRPSCVNCLTANRHCPYLDDRKSCEATHDAPAPTAETIRTGVDDLEVIRPIELVLHGIPKDLLYIELLQQWLNQTYLTCVGPRDKAAAFGAIAFNHALNSPFLMRSMLAVAGLHKASTMEGFAQQKYLAVSEDLQSEGLARFNSLMSDLDTSTIVPAFLFAFITGIHRLCVALSCACQQENFLASVIDAMTFLRGVNTIISGWWPYIRNSELSILIPAPTATSTEGAKICQAEEILCLRKLVEDQVASKSLLNAYNAVIDGLQVGYNDMKTSEAEDALGFVVVWMITMPFDFIQCLNERRPEALILLAHSAPLLHCRRGHWAVGSAGEALVTAISSHLSDSWHVWLHKAKSIVDQC